ncbi:MAG: hypothetical protein BWZ08_02569 [candidate division BRC1 bacterium ADurb.BinA292]|nr:MAG: hypothetical protein BWZ08_02569 [candidate division BRC1 bacterium ADurb.BinA292]
MGAGQHEDVHRAQQRSDVALEAGKDHALAQPEGMRLGAQAGRARPLADQQDAQPRFRRRQPGGRLEDQVLVLDRREPADRSHHDGLVGNPPMAADRGALDGRRRPEPVRVDPVDDDLDAIRARQTRRRRAAARHDQIGVPEATPLQGALVAARAAGRGMHVRHQPLDAQPVAEIFRQEHRRDEVGMHDVGAEPPDVRAEAWNQSGVETAARQLARSEARLGKGGAQALRPPQRRDRAVNVQPAQLAQQAEQVGLGAPQPQRIDDMEHSHAEHRCPRIVAMTRRAVNPREDERRERRDGARISWESSATRRGFAGSCESAA